MNAWLARQRYLIDYVLAAMARQKGRAIGLWVVYTLLVFVLASVMLFTHALRQESARVLQHAPEVVRIDARDDRPRRAAVAELRDDPLPPP